MNTCLLVHIRTGVNESVQRKGERANVSHMSAGITGDDFHVVGYWKLLGVKLLTGSALEWQSVNPWLNVAATRPKSGCFILSLWVRMASARLQDVTCSQLI